MEQKTINDYLQVNDLNDLIEYIIRKVFNKEVTDKLKNEFLLEQNDITFEYNDVFFNVKYIRGKVLEITCDEKDSYEEDRMQDKLKPLMWYSVLDDTDTDQNIWGAPIIKFEDGSGNHHIYWNVYKPIESIQYMAFEYHVLHSCYDMTIDYYDYDTESCKNLIKKGEYPVNFSKEDIDNMETCTEFELYRALNNIENKYINVISISDFEQNFTLNTEAKILEYKMEYLKQVAARRFEIKINKPDFDNVEQTPDIIAWQRWWQEGVRKARKNPFILLIWDNLPKGYDPKFRPKGSYLKLVPAIKKELELAKMHEENNSNYSLSN